MGLFDMFSGKEEVPKKGAKAPLKNHEQLFLNMRDGIRYPVNDISVGEIGAVVEISRGGLKLRKSSSAMIDTPEIMVPIVGKTVRARVVWQDDKHAGLELGSIFEDVNFILKNIKRVKDAIFRPMRRLSEESILGYLEKDIFNTIVNLMAELETQHTNLQKLRVYLIKVPGLKEEIAAKAGIEKKEGEELEVKDIDFAIKRIGLDPVKSVSAEYIKKNGPKLDSSQSDLYETQKVLKAVFVPKLASYFGFKDEQGTANSLLMLETKGLDIINTKGGRDMKNFYQSPLMIYSEMTRFFEKLNFGKDLVHVNKIYVNNVKRSFAPLYNGYILAHFARNLHYNLDKEIKINLTALSLNFSFIVYLTFLISEAFIDKERGSATILMQRLKRTGMDDEKLSAFMTRNVREINSIMRDIGRTSVMKDLTFSGASFKIRDFLPKEPHYDRFFRYFRDFISVKRMVVRYEDETYTHYILGKILDSAELGFTSKVFCVIPCENLSQDEIQTELFSYFGLLVFKNIDKLHKSLLRSFVKLWNSFDGHILLTFSSYGMLDYNMRDLFVLLRKYIVDFPSYFDDQKIYSKMVDHTLNYVTPYTAGKTLDSKRYLEDYYTMNHIRGNELISKIPDEPDEPDELEVVKDKGTIRFKYNK